MDAETEKRIEQTVLEMLKTADMEEMTEFKLRVSASEKLGMDLSSIDCKKFIRNVVDSFLLSTMQPEGNNHFNLQQAVPNKELDSEGKSIICKLSNKRSVAIQEFYGKTYVSIREFYYKDGKQLPSNRGINLPPDQWSSFRKSVPLIEEAIAKMQAKLRTRIHGEQISKTTTSNHSQLNMQSPGSTAFAPSELKGQISTATTTFCDRNGGISSLVTNTASEVNGEASCSTNTFMCHEPNAQVSESLTTSACHELDGQVSDSTTYSTLHGLVPFEINRFDGKNYRLWAPVMELFLKQLNIAYVLTELCPSVATRPDTSADEITQAKAAEQKWFNDDYLCRRNILVCLSDALYNRYSKKTKNARELWEELKSVYHYEEFGQKRSLVRKYIEFRIVEEKPILEQVQELNNLADSVIAAGMFFDEKFHVSTIISKLPPSWKDISIKLMSEEHLPFRTLMDRIKAEEDLINQEKQVDTSSVAFNNAKNLGPRGTDMKRSGANGKRPEADTDNKVLVCYFCGKKGHISNNCRDKKVDEENSSAAAAIEIKTEQP